MLSSLSSYRRFVVQHVASGMWRLAQLAFCVRRPQIVGSFAACEFSMLNDPGMLTFRSDMLLRMDGSVDAFYIGATGKCRRLRSS
jgi:hypothetical protein